MLAVSRFNRTNGVDLGKVGTGEGPLVHNLFNARTGGGSSFDHGFLELNVLEDRNRDLFDKRCTSLCELRDALR